MKIIINDHRKIFDIQEEFNAVFPYLKLEFLFKPHIKQTGKTLGECRNIHNSGEIIINTAMTVKQLGLNFRNRYGLEMRLLRKSGKLWLETTVTENWTLEEQNIEGEALSRGFF